MIQLLNMSGGKRQVTKDEIMKWGTRIPFSYVEKTPTLFYFFLDVDFKHNETDFKNLEEKTKVIDSILPKETKYIAKCSKNKGFHIIFPDLVVNKLKALELFDTLENSKNYFDKSVYNTALRILFAPKPNETRVYKPYQYRTEHEIINLDENKWYPEFFITVNSEINNKVQTKSECVPTNELGFYKIKKYKDKIYLYTTDKKCRNLINGSHKGNNIYYVLEGNYLRQKCWCRCETLENRKYTMCKDFTSEPIPISWKLANSLKNKILNV